MLFFITNLGPPSPHSSSFDTKIPKNKKKIKQQKKMLKLNFEIKLKIYEEKLIRIICVCVCGMMSVICVGNIIVNQITIANFINQSIKLS